MSHEILLAVIVLLLLFGPSKIPALGKSMGEAIRGFKKGLSESDEKPVQQIVEDSSGSSQVKTQQETQAGTQNNKDKEKDKVQS